MTKDEDSRKAQDPRVRVLWLRVGNCSNDVLLRALGEALPQIIAQFEQGEWLVEVR